MPNAFIAQEAQDRERLQAERDTLAAQLAAARAALTEIASGDQWIQASHPITIARNALAKPACQPPAMTDREILIAQLSAVRVERDTLAAQLAAALAALKRARQLLAYARYELAPKHTDFEQFPCQECADKQLADIDAALAAKEAPGE